MDLKDPLIIKQLIMDHYEFPRHHSLKRSAQYKSKHMAAESCIDDIEVEIKFENEKISDIGFDGKACTISTASTSMLSELIYGKTLSEALYILEQYHNMVQLKDYDKKILEEANAFSSVGRQANRINCALIGWKALYELVLEELKNLQIKES